MKGEMKLERGVFEWPVGYAPPADSDRPTQRPPVDPPYPIPEEEHLPPTEYIVDRPPQPAAVPDERINLDDGTAMFRGYPVQLSESARAEIERILAEEVCRVLTSEQVRIMGSLQHQGMQPINPVWPDLQQVPATEVEVGEAEPDQGQVS